jgi:hypothetical protein
MKTINLLTAFVFICSVGHAQETLQTVTDRGNATTNSLQIGGSSVNANTTKLFIRNPMGKTFALSAGANYATEQGFHIYNWTDKPGTPLLSLSNDGNLEIGGFHSTNNGIIDGSVGIGAASPISKLDVRGPMVKNNYGFVTPVVNAMTTDAPGIGVGGTIALGGKTGNANPEYAFSYLIGAKETTTYNNYAGYFAINTVSGGGNGEANSGNYERFRIASNGNVSIGTSDAKGYKLAVAGNMIAESVKVQLQSAWPDYVFKKDYQLPSLEETENQIKENGHLPGIPSANEVKSNGIDLGEMNAILLKKIEELTLHLIEQKKELNKVKYDFLKLKHVISKRSK